MFFRNEYDFRTVSEIKNIKIYIIYVYVVSDFGVGFVNCNVRKNKLNKNAF